MTLTDEPSVEGPQHGSRLAQRRVLDVLGMNPDAMAPAERSASTSNRGFGGGQGAGARTHLVSAAVAAAIGVVGRLAAAPGDLV